MDDLAQRISYLNDLARAGLRPRPSALSRNLTSGNDPLAQLREQSHASAGTTVQDAQDIVNSESAWAEVVQKRDTDSEPVDDDSDGPPDDEDGESNGQELRWKI